ncbi:aminopeptidase P family protein [Facklamia sp. DSM 111018]|uniref:Aminopeptidase P family protein n=1 Tax=Facklamia lactis TaxID=2749967 RepID=A0ABS0LR98_9LACT|nr:Xaa-Pro peptidase family protein [Facklamia lactis]MBG9986603.1 aminopeptidase P family protein [Facklamia lactis]
MSNKLLNKLLTLMQKEQISNLLISDPFSINYLCNYYTDPGERLLLLDIKIDGQINLFINQLFPKFHEDNSSINPVYYKDGEAILTTIAKQLIDGKVGIDKNWPSQHLITLMNYRKDLIFINGSPLIDSLRARKNTEEIVKMKKVSLQNDQAMNRIMQKLSDQLSEQQMVQYLDQVYTELNCDGFSFDPIIAYGANGADPHHQTSKKQPQIGESIIVDIGCLQNGYCSDMTRTFFYGQVSSKDQAIYQTVLEAQLAAINQVKPGVSCSSIDQAARSVIERAGYGNYFTHRTGHFIGQEVHEEGDISPYNHQPVEVGNIFSIEPGIYLPNQMGVRIEDLVLVTEDGYELLNHFTKDLIIIDTDKS